MSEIEHYREAVLDLFESKSPQLISNGKPEHAAIIFGAFFKLAQASIRILCRKLDPLVFDTPEVVESAAAALKRGVVIDILVQEEVAPNSKFLQRLKDLSELANGRFELLQRASARSSMVRNTKGNFAIMDEKAFRFEPDADKVQAVAGIDSTLSEKLISIFNSLRFDLISESPAKA